VTRRRLLRSELRKLVTTSMPWAFLLVLAAIAATTATAVVVGTDADGSKAFISTEADQRSLMAFAANAVIIAALFGATAVAREYGHRTVVPTFIAVPRRLDAVAAQYGAVAVGGAILGLAGATFTVIAVAASLPTTEYGFLVSGTGVARILAASTSAGAAGALLGAGIGALVRNTGGAVTGVVLALVVAPPLLIQLAPDTASWVPGALADVTSGVADHTGVVAAVAAILTWALVPAAIGAWTTQRRDLA
jgi:ABC-2 type transport system permease protein